MAVQLTKQDVTQACSDIVWDLGNSMLYELCKKYPEHKADDVILAKILIIGRVYAAAIERRKDVAERGDDFYFKNLLPKIKKSHIDRWINGLPARIEDGIGDILSVHNSVTYLFNSISGMDKRSLASKYLHFHKPHLFFIYDDRALTGLRMLTPRMRADLSIYCQDKMDKDYAAFFVRCLSVRKRINDKWNVTLSPRELDKVLLLVTSKSGDLSI